MDIILKFIAQKTVHLSANSVYQIITGKRTAATLFFAYKNDLSAYFNLFPELSKQAWMTIVEDGLTGGQGSENVPENQTNQQLSLRLLSQVLPFRQGMVVPANHHSRHIALKLLIQTLSFAAAKQKHYVPLTNQLFIQQMIKEFFHYYQAACGWTKVDMAQQAYAALESLLSPFTDEENKILLFKFEGHELSAWTDNQIGAYFNLPPEIVAILNQAFIDRLLRCALEIKDETNILHMFACQLDQAFPAWNQSVDFTASLLKAGNNLDQISAYRRLKPSTIADHFVEISISQPDILLAEAQKIFAIENDDLLKTLPPESFKEFQEQSVRFADMPFWGYRYWQIYYLHTQRQQADSH